ncbi:MAG: DUF3313 family protein [Xanthomonadales bacterium]|nr:DUF3313 family protein [Xanthomonadales bacterium]
MPVTDFKTLPARAWLALLAVTLAACSATRPQAENTEGLAPVEPAAYRWAWVRPGADLARYDQVVLAEPEVRFRDHWQRDYNRSQRELIAQLDDADVAGIRARLIVATRQAFEKELTEAGIDLVARPGPGSLLAEVELLDVDIHAPDVLTPGLREVYVESAGEMTLSLTLRDGASGEVLYRAVERREDPRMAWPQRQTAVENYAAALRILGSWGHALAGLLRPA